ncbi:MAG: hypothetical protein KDI88_12905 [Gammaproteobacteria bacterium]|nr:hypothetical protein [Gammaproteobacteria bacterium]
MKPLKRPRPIVYCVAIVLGLLAVTVAQASGPWLTRSAGADGCILFAEVPEVDDGYSLTPVRVEIIGSRLTVLTESNIDTTLGPLGLSVDGGTFMQADRVESGTNLVFEDQVQEMVQAFIRGSNARLTLRFWPTWPQTGDKQVDFSLKGFTQAYNSALTCG